MNRTIIVVYYVFKIKIRNAHNAKKTSERKTCEVVMICIFWVLCLQGGQKK